MSEKIQMPSSGGGLIRYFDEFRSRISIKPIHFVIFIAIVIILEFILYKMQ